MSDPRAASDRADALLLLDGQVCFPFCAPANLINRMYRADLSQRMEAAGSPVARAIRTTGRLAASAGAR